VRRQLLLLASVSLLLGLAACTPGQGPTTPSTSNASPGAGTPPPPNSDVQMVERVLASRKEYQASLEALRAYYISVRDLKRAKWAEEELLQFHRITKEAYRLDLDPPPPKLQPIYPIPEANELYRRALTYKDKGWGMDYVDNQHRAEILLQELLTKHPQSDKIADSAYLLGDIYEGRGFNQPERAAVYFERVFQWAPTTTTDARLRAARLYDRKLGERSKAMELYREVAAHETDQRHTQEAQRRLLELSSMK
jgi:tetratricopeptide (TPR) repeat protein